MAITPNTLFSSGAVLTATQQNNFPRGVMAATTRTAGNVVLATTEADITGVSVTWTAAASRSYKISWNITAEKTTASGWIAIYLTNSANTKFASIYQTVTVVGAGYANLSGCCYLGALSAGSQTFKLRGQLENLNGQVLASGTNPAILIVEDIGTA